MLEHNGFRVYETQAILRYLDRVLPEPPLTPAAVQGSARMDQMMNVNDCYLFQGVANVIAFQRVVGPRLFGLTPDETAIAAAMPKAAAVFAELASALGTQHYMAGDALSLADLLIAPQLDFMILTPEWEQLVGPYPALRIWMARMQDRASLKATTWEEVARKAQVH